MSPSSGELYKFDTLTSTFSLVSVAPSLEGNQPEDRSFHVLTTHGVSLSTLYMDTKDIASSASNADAANDLLEPCTFQSTLYLHAGCPIRGRLPTLHSLDISSSSPAWKALPSAPGPGRGGTNLALVHPPASSSPFFARFGGFAGHELSDLALFCLSTGEWSSPTLKAGSPTPAPRSVAGFVGLPAPLAISPESAILAYLFLGEADPTAPEVGHDGAGGFHEASPVWAFCSTAEETVFEWKQVDVLEGGDRPEGLGWFGADWWEGGHGAVLFGGLESGNERRGDGWVLRIEVK